MFVPFIRRDMPAPGPLGSRILRRRREQARKPRSPRAPLPARSLIRELDGPQCHLCSVSKDKFCDSSLPPRPVSPWDLQDGAMHAGKR